MAGIAKASPEVNERVARALKESHGGSRSGPGPWDMSGIGAPAVGVGAPGPGPKEARDKDALSSGQALKHCASQREPPGPRHSYGASKSGPIHQDRRESLQPGRPGAGGGRTSRDSTPGTLGTSSRQSRAAGVNRASTGTVPAPRAGRAALGTKSGELGRTPVGHGMSSKSGELPRAGSLKSASGDSGMPGSRSSSAARRSAPGVPGDTWVRGAKSGELSGPRRPMAGAAAGARPAAGSARGVPGRRVSRQGPTGFSSRSQPLIQASAAPLAEPATDSEWSELEATDTEDDCSFSSGRHMGGKPVQGPGKVPRSQSQPLIHGAPAEDAGIAEEEGAEGPTAAVPGWSEVERASELGESFDAESYQGQADGVPASDTESQVGWEAGRAGCGEDSAMPGFFVALMHRDRAGGCDVESTVSASESAASEALLHLQQISPEEEPLVEPEEVAAGVPMSQNTVLQKSLGRGSSTQEAGEGPPVQADDGDKEGCDVEPEMYSTATSPVGQGEEEGAQGGVAWGQEAAGWSEWPATAQGVQDYAQAMAVLGDSSELGAGAVEGVGTEGPLAALPVPGPEQEGKALHRVPQGLPEAEEAQQEGDEGRVEPRVHQQVLREALSSLECSPMKGLIGRAGHLGDRMGLECSPMKGLVVQIPGDDEEEEGAHAKATGGVAGEEGVGMGGGEGEEGEEFPWTPVSDLPDTFGTQTADKGKRRAQPQLWTGQEPGEEGGLAVAFGTLAVHHKAEGEHALPTPDAETEAQVPDPEATGTFPADRHMLPPSLPERSGGRTGYAGRVVSREILMMASAGTSPGPFPFSQSQGSTLTRGNSNASADMFSCASSLRSPSCGDLTPTQGSLTPPLPAVGVPMPKGRAMPRSQSLGKLQAPSSEGGMSQQSPAHGSPLFVGTPPSETDMGSCLISPSGELHPELVRAAAEAATAGAAAEGEEASGLGFSLPGNITPDQLKSPRDILAAAAMILQASQQLQQQQMQLQSEGDGAPELDEQPGQGQAQGRAGRGVLLPSGGFESVPMSLRNSGDFEEPGAAAKMEQEMATQEDSASVQGQGQGVLAGGAPRGARKLRRASSGVLYREDKGDRSQPSTTPLGRSSSSSRTEGEGAPGSRFTPSPVLPSRFMPSPTALTARQPVAGGHRRSSSSSRLPHSQSCSSNLADLSLSGSGSVNPHGRISRSTSEDKVLPPDEDTVKHLAGSITDYYIALELENKLDKNEEHDDRTSLGRINFVLENIIVF